MRRAFHWAPLVLAGFWGAALAAEGCFSTDGFVDGTGTTTPPTGCASAAECGTPTPCVSYACTAQACKATYAKAMTQLADTTKGDCKRPVCDGHGGTVEVYDSADLPVSTNACVTETCGDGGPNHAFATAGAACASEAGAHVCDGTGSCVACNQATDCAANGAYCYAHDCASCADGAQDGDETGVDCGGAHCLKCNGDACTSYTDCASNSCSGGTCYPCAADAQCGTGHCTNGTCSP